MLGSSARCCWSTRLSAPFKSISAQRAAESLHKLVTTNSRVLREADAYEINAERLVPGDIVLLESGDRVPADLRLLAGHDLEVDESLLTGESEAVFKDPDRTVASDSEVGDRVNMAFAGTLVTRGRGRGVVVGTALKTQLGRIAAGVLGKRAAKAPLLVRMERFTHRVAIVVVVAALHHGRRGADARYAAQRDLFARGRARRLGNPRRAPGGAHRGARHRYAADG